MMFDSEEEIPVRSAIFAGSFDPPTKGHENIIVRASKLFDKLYVAMAHNPKKKYKFFTETRYKMLESIIKANKLDNVEIITVTSNELTVDRAKELGASVLIRSCRNAKDFEYESELAYNNRLLNSEIETLILPVEPKFYYISSTNARAAIDDLIFKGHVEEGYKMLANYVPESTYKYFNFFVGCPGKDVKMRDYVDGKQETTV